MTRKAITSTVLAAIALGISIGAIYLMVKYPVLTDQAEANHAVAGGRGSAELPNPDGRLSRVHMLLSRMK
jgi:hypothetical protein